MVACPYGAERIAGKPKYYRVTAADIERWYPDAGALFYAWMRPMVGKLYDIDALAELNPDVPAAVTWQDFLTDALRVWGVFGNTRLSTVAEEQVQFFVFLDNCACKPGTLSTDWVLFKTEHITCTNAEGNKEIFTSKPAGAEYARQIIDIVTPSHGLWYCVWTGSSSGRHEAGDGHCPTGNCTCSDHDHIITMFPETESVSFVYQPAGGWPDIDAQYYCYFKSSTGLTGSLDTPVPAPTQPVWTDMPAYTAPSGTTTDDLEVKLDAILRGMATVIDVSVASQRQVAPFAYIVGTEHAGLEGDGELSVEQLLGFSVTLTTVPDYLGRHVETPDRLIDAGRISLGTADGYGPSQIVEHESSLFVPIDGSVTKIGYHFNTGVVATITEIEREP